MSLLTESKPGKYTSFIGEEEEERRGVNVKVP